MIEYKNKYFTDDVLYEHNCINLRDDFVKFDKSLNKIKRYLNPEPVKVVRSPRGPGFRRGSVADIGSFKTLYKDSDKVKIETRLVPSGPKSKRSVVTNSDEVMKTIDSLSIDELTNDIKDFLTAKLRKTIDQVEKVEAKCRADYRRYRELFEESESEFRKLEKLYVPSYGPAKTVGGEIIRAFQYIEYRLYNDGDTVGCGLNENVDNSWYFLRRYISYYDIKTDHYLRDRRNAKDCKRFWEIAKYYLEMQKEIVDLLRRNPSLLTLENKEESR